MADLIKLIINFPENSSQAELELMFGSSLLGQLIIRLDIHFGTVLVTSIDKILKKNRIDKSSLERVEVRPETGLDSLAYRISQAVAEAMKVNKNAV